MLMLTHGGRGDFCTIKRTVSGGLIAGIFGQALPFPQCRYFCAQFCAIRATSHYLCIYALPCTTASRLFTPIPPAITTPYIHHFLAMPVYSTISAHTLRLIITRAIRLISGYHSLRHSRRDLATNWRALLLRHAPCYQAMNRRICIHAPCQSFITPCTAIYAPNAETS